MDDLATLQALRDLDVRIDEATAREDLRGLGQMAAEAAQLANDIGDDYAAEHHRAVVGICLTLEGRFEEALRLLEDAPRRLRQVGRSPARAQTCLARCLRAVGRPDEAIEVYEQALVGLEATKDWPLSLNVHVELASALLERGSPEGRDRASTLLTVAEQRAQLSCSRRDWDAAMAMLRQLRPPPQQQGWRDKIVAGVKRARAWDPLVRSMNTLEEVLVKTDRGELAEAEALLGYMTIGVDFLAPATAAMRTQLHLDTACMASETARRQGDWRRALSYVNNAIARLAYDVGHQSRQVRETAARAFTDLANVLYVLGAEAPADEAAKHAMGLAQGLRSTRLEAQVGLKLAKAYSGEPAVAGLRHVLDLTVRDGSVDIRCEALLALASETQDADSALHMLDEAEKLVPAVAALYKGSLLPGTFGLVRRYGRFISQRETPEHTSDVAGQLRTLIAMQRIDRLALVDPSRAAALLARHEASLAPFGSALDLLRFVVAVRLGRADEELVDAALRAAPTIVAQIEAASDQGRRGAAFESLESAWALALHTLAAAGDRRTGATSLQLVESANRGSLASFAHRGATVGLALDDLAGLGDDDSIEVRLERTAESLSTAPRLDDNLPAELIGRPAIAFAVTTYEQANRLRGVKVVIGRDGVAEAIPFEVTGPALALLEDPVATADGPPAVSGSAAWVGELATAADPAWIDLSALLLGPAVEGILATPPPDEDPTVLIAPGHPLLARVPWCALWLRNKLLVHEAAVQLTPSLSLLTGERSRPVPAGRALLYTVDERGEGRRLHTAGEIDAWNSQPTWYVSAVTAPQGLVDALRTRNGWKVGYVAAHGSGSGLDHVLRHADLTELTVGDALSLWWPDLVILSSCQTGSLRSVPGADPLGLPLAFLLRGARHVIGCNELVLDAGASSIGAALVANLAAGVPPVAALRSAQLGWLPEAGWADELLVSWAPFQAVSLC